MLASRLTVQPFGVCTPSAPLVLCAAAALAELASVGDGEVVAMVAEGIDDETFDAEDVDLDESVCGIVVGSAVS